MNQETTKQIQTQNGRPNNPREKKTELQKGKKKEGGKNPSVQQRIRRRSKAARPPALDPNRRAVGAEGGGGSHGATELPSFRLLRASCSRDGASSSSSLQDNRIIMVAGSVVTVEFHFSRGTFRRDNPLSLSPSSPLPHGTAGGKQELETNSSKQPA